MENTFRIEVFTKIFDTRAETRKKKLINSGFQNIQDVWLVDIFTISKEFNRLELDQIASALSNPVTQTAFIQSVKNTKTYNFDWAIEIGFLPGVTDNIAHTVKEIIEDLIKKKFYEDEDVYTSQITYIKGEVNNVEIKQIAADLYNPLIQRVHIKNKKQFTEDYGMDLVIPKVKLEQKANATYVDLNVSDEELVNIGKFGIKEADGTRRGPLALDLLFMHAIQKYFKNLGRNPKDLELESLAQTWSEHCKHTIFANPIDEVKDGLFKHYIKRATAEIRKKSPGRNFCVSVFTDNSGAIGFDEKNLISYKVETHNSPSALDPFGGAITGIVGVNRDTIGFGLGAKPVANFYGFCFADPGIDIPLYKNRDKSQKMLSSRRIMDGVIDGINAGGNQSGIPTPQGFICFDERYRGKPLVFAGTVGIIPRKIGNRLSHKKKANPGDYIVMAGGRVGKDGIHGATFSSEALGEQSPATAVQIGDPITQKKLSDALMREGRNMLLYNSITDNGAGGLSCSVSEMAEESGGCIVDLEKVPLKYPGLMPWEIWVSESQERMTLAVPKNKWRILKKLMDKWGVEVTIIGEFTKSGKCIVKHNGKIIMDIDLQFLHKGLPKRPQKTSVRLSIHKEPEIPEPKNLTKSLQNMLGRLNIASFEFISQQYDHVVLGNSVLLPLQGRGRVNGDASVIRPVNSSKKGVVLSQGYYPSYSDIDCYHMAAASLDTAVRNAVAAGANPQYLAILDNFCWSSSNDPERLWQLKRAAKACFDYATIYKTPFISGKDSMFNDFTGFDKDGKSVKISIPPTLLITSIGVMEDVSQTVSLDAKIPGDLVYILNDTFDEMGASEYFAMQGEKKKTLYIGNMVPKVNARKNRKLYDSYYSCIKKGFIASAQSVNRGGLGIALVKKAMGGMLGLKIDLRKLPGKVSREDYALFSESQGRIAVTVAPENRKIFEALIKGSAFSCIGEVSKDPKFVITGLNGDVIVKTDIYALLNSYRDTFKGY